MHVTFCITDGIMVLENRNCTQCHLRIKRDDCFYIYKTSRSSQLCQSCFIKSNLPEDSFKLGAYEPGKSRWTNYLKLFCILYKRWEINSLQALLILHIYVSGHPELDNDGMAAAGANQASRPPGGVQQQAGNFFQFHIHFRFLFSWINWT